jgi:hypothetical protein
MSEKRLTDAELDHLLAVFDTLAQQSRSIRVHHEGSVDIRALSALQELRALRAREALRGTGSAADQPSAGPIK